jgi:hypothetical protein
VIVWCHIPEDKNIHYHHDNDLRSHNESLVSVLISRIVILCFRMEISWYENPRAHLASMY